MTDDPPPARAPLAPQRITKKYAGEHCIGKRVFQPCERSPENMAEAARVQRELEMLERAFLDTMVERADLRAFYAAVSQRPYNPLDLYPAAALGGPRPFGLPPHLAPPGMYHASPFGPRPPFFPALSMGNPYADPCNSSLSSLSVASMSGDDRSTASMQQGLPGAGSPSPPPALTAAPPLPGALFGSSERIQMLQLHQQQAREQQQMLEQQAGGAGYRGGPVLNMLYPPMSRPSTSPVPPAAPQRPVTTSLSAALGLDNPGKDGEGEGMEGVESGGEEQEGGERRDEEAPTAAGSQADSPVAKSEAEGGKDEGSDKEARSQGKEAGVEAQPKGGKGKGGAVDTDKNAFLDFLFSVRKEHKGGEGKGKREGEGEAASAGEGEDGEDSPARKRSKSGSHVEA
jgi:hypothetical protein